MHGRESDVGAGGKESSLMRATDKVNNLQLDKELEEKVYPWINGLVTQFAELHTENMILKHQVRTLEEQLKNLNIKPTYSNLCVESLNMADSRTQTSTQPLINQDSNTSFNIKSFNNSRQRKLTKIIKKAMYHTDDRNCTFIPSQTRVGNLNPETSHKDLIWDLTTWNIMGNRSSVEPSPYLISLVASASADATCKVWDLRTMNLVATYTGHNSSVNCIKVVPSMNLEANRIICSASDDCTLQLWEFPEELFESNDQDTSVLDLSIDSSMSNVFGYSPNTPITIHKPKSVFTSEPKEGSLLKFDFASHADSVVSISIFGNPRCWDLATGQFTTFPFSAKNLQFSDVICHPTERRAIFSSKNGSILLVDLKTSGGSGPNTFYSFLAHESAITSSQVTSENTLLTSGEDGYVRLFDLRNSGKVLGSLKMNSPVVNMELSPQGLVSFSLSNGSLYVCDVKKMKYVNKLLEPDNSSHRKKAIICSCWSHSTTNTTSPHLEDKNISNQAGNNSSCYSPTLNSASQTSRFGSLNYSSSVNNPTFSHSLVTANLEYHITHWNFSFHPHSPQ